MTHSFRDRITPEMAERLYELIYELPTCRSTGADGDTLSIYGPKEAISELNFLLHGHDTTTHAGKEKE